MKTEELLIEAADTNQNKEYKKSYIPLTFYKIKGNIGEKVLPESLDSNRLHELSLMKNTCFGLIYYDIHLDMKLGYMVRSIFQEISLSEVETLHKL